AADPDRRTAVLAMFGHGHRQENSGDPAAAIETATRALELTTDDDGPWYRAILHAQLCHLYAQLGRLEVAARHAGPALAVLERLEATDDVLQVRGVLALAALGDG